VEEVVFERREQVALVTLNRPEKMNSLTPDMQVRLREIWGEFRDDPGLRVAVITGMGRAFCAGRDLRAAGPGSPEFHRAQQEARDRGETLETRQASNGASPDEVWKPVIAAINGHCLAAGYALAMSCDIRIASEHASLGMPAAKRGLFSSGQALRTLLSAPWGWALEMMFTGEAVDAATAFRLGLVNHVVPPDDLLPAAFRLAEKICACAPLSVAAHKELAYRSLDMVFSDAARLEREFYTRMLETEDVMEGSRAFAEKRPPVFQGR
jgi:enoyl-CoA hydratase/carnithine racemase